MNVVTGISPKVHAAGTGEGSKRDGSLPTLCGTRSYGHHETDAEITCGRCLKKLAKS